LLILFVGHGYLDEQGVKKLFVIYNLEQNELLQAILALFVYSQSFFHWFEHCEQKDRPSAIGLSSVSKKTKQLQLV
jgi:hypothetical protein